jgi:two-component system, OmpR family, response regulator
MADDLANLDFTRLLQLRARAPAAATPAAPAPAAVSPAPSAPVAPASAKVPAAETPAAETPLSSDTRIGLISAADSGNVVTYASPGAPRAPAPADAPVLVVEDDEITRQLLQQAMQIHGLPVRTAGDSREFAQELRKPPLPRLILLDVDLPGTNGFRILELLRQNPRTGSIPIVMVTSHSAPGDVVQALTLGAEGYLSKPVTLNRLRAVVAKVLTCKP